MKISVSRAAQEDLLVGFRFYEQQTEGVGGYFLDALFSDIDSLVLYAGIHPQLHGYYRMLSKRFPFDHLLQDRTPNRASAACAGLSRQSGMD